MERGLHRLNWPRVFSLLQTDSRALDKLCGKNATKSRMDCSDAFYRVISMRRKCKERDDSMDGLETPLCLVIEDLSRESIQ